MICKAKGMLRYFTIADLGQYFEANCTATEREIGLQERGLNGGKAITFTHARARIAVVLFDSGIPCPLTISTGFLFNSGCKLLKGFTHNDCKHANVRRPCSVFAFRPFLQ